MEKIKTDWILKSLANLDFEKFSQFFSKYTNDDVAPLIGISLHAACQEALMAKVLDSGSSALCSSPGLGTMLCSWERPFSYSAFLFPGVEITVLS